MGGGRGGGGGRPEAGINQKRLTKNSRSSAGAWTGGLSPEGGEAGQGEGRLEGPDASEGNRMFLSDSVQCAVRESTALILMPGD